MEKNHHQSWKSSSTLKNNVLSQLEAHYEKAVLESVEIDSVPVEIYGWKNPIDYPLCAKMLGLEEAVLHLGFYLWEGFPEDRKGIRALIQGRMELLENIPLGVDLSQVGPEFIVWRLENADFGIIDSQVHQTIEPLLLEITEVFYQDAPDMQPVRQKVHLAIQEANSHIRTLWQKEKKTDMEAYRTLNALETAAAACTAPTSAAGAAETARTYLFGANGTNVRNLEAEIDIMSHQLLDLIKAAPQSR